MTAMDAPSASLTRKLPFYMRDNYAPVTEEVEATNLDVVGAQRMFNEVCIAVAECEPHHSMLPNYLTV